MSDLMIQTKGRLPQTNGPDDPGEEPELVPFAPNAVQIIYLNAICPKWRDGDYSIRGLREDILKARQFGFSTLILALIYLNTVNAPNIRSVIIAHDGPTTESLFEIVQRFHDNLPAHKRPRTDLENRRMIGYPDLDSSLAVRTAGTYTAGRGLTIHYLHCSETAFWKRRLTGLFDAVPAGGAVFKESTANGEGNAHHQNYLAAKGLTEFKTPYTARFFAWWQHPEYQRSPDKGFKPTSGNSPRPMLDRYGNEGELIRLYGVTLRQLAWRRWKIDDPEVGSMFRQEYPANDEEAFQVSGAKFFPGWNPVRHIIRPGFPDQIPKHWERLAGLDGGYFPSFFCFELAAIDEHGNVHFYDELYAQRLDGDTQADMVFKLLLKQGLGPKKVTIFADPSMWNQNRASGRIRGYADIHPFLKRGLRCVPGDNHQKSGMSNFRQYLHDEGAFNIHDGCCPNLERTIAMQKHGDRQPDKRDPKIEDHPVDAANYLLHSRIRASKPAPKSEAPKPGHIDYSQLMPVGEADKWLNMDVASWQGR